MKFLSQMLLILFPIPCPPYWAIRVNSLIPAFAQIEEELRNLNSSDHWTLAEMIVSECLRSSGKPTADLEDEEIGKEAI